MLVVTPEARAKSRRTTAPANDVTSALDTASATSVRRRRFAFTAHERRIARSLAAAAMPGGPLPGGGDATVDRLEAMLSDLRPGFANAVRAGLWTAESWSVPRFGRPFTLLSPEAQARALERWSESGSRHERWLLRAIVTPLKSAHFDAPELYAHVGCRHVDGESAVALGARAPSTPRVDGESGATARDERGSWMRQVTDGRATTDDLDLVCEVVVVGTGAGGAAAAYELARRGRAVLLLEAGRYHARSEFRGRATESYRRMYLGLGATIALGNIAAPVFAGRGVGGSTTINSGTCYRAPEWVLDRWVDELGLDACSPSGLAPYYERVESMLGVAEAPREHLGGAARVIARGADLLQLSHRPLARNAPGCDGQGVCCFGCPSGAKRSTDVSYVPEALKRGAQLVTGAQVERVVVEGGRARGVVARLASGRTLTVRAEAVVVAGGALLTPLLLGRSGACSSSGWLGKNLSIHPATKVMALFDELIDPARGIPQSYAIDSYAREGLMFEGASTPLDVTAVSVPWVGRRFMDVMARYPNIATFGFMIADESRGEVRPGVGGMPLIVYNMKRGDVARMQRGLEILSEVFLEAGAKRVMPMVAGCEEIEDAAGLARLRRMRVRAGDFEVSAYHPLGTCRMGADPRRSCVGPDGEAHDVAGLFVADGSAVPTALGVNPQMTIMALALKSAEALDARLDRIAARGAPPARAAVGFDETMSGTLRSASSPDVAKPLSFSLHARARSLGDFLRTREVAITGELCAEGFGARCPLEGKLGLHVIPRGTLPYDFTFTADDGRTYRFTGKKRVKLGALLRSMTWLPGRILDDAGTEIATAEVRFDLARDGWQFAKSWLGRT